MPLNRRSLNQKLWWLFINECPASDAGGGEAVAGNEHQSELPAHAESDNAGVSIAAGLGREPGTSGLDVIEGGSAASDEVTHDGASGRKTSGNQRLRLGLSMAQFVQLARHYENQRSYWGKGSGRA